MASQEQQQQQNKLMDSKLHFKELSYQNRLDFDSPFTM